MPISLAAALIPAGVQAATGLFQTIFSGRKKQERELEKQLGKSPMYQKDKGILDYYQKALSRYNENPYQSAQYQTGVKNAQRLTSTGINALQDRRSALSGINKLVGIENDAIQNAGVQAEQQRNVRFNQLGNATDAQAGEQRRSFEINTMSPYLRRLQMQQMKTGAANARFDAGISNLFGAAGSAASILSNTPSNKSQGSAIGSQQQTVGMNSLGGNMPQSFNNYNWNRPNSFSNKSYLTFNPNNRPR